MTLELIQSPQLTPDPAREPSIPIYNFETVSKAIASYVPTLSPITESAEETPLIKREVIESPPNMPSRILQSVFQNIADDLTLAEAAHYICNHISKLLNIPYETTEAGLSRPYFIDIDHFYKNCLTFIESIRTLPDNGDTIDDKIKKALRAYKNCQGFMNGPPLTSIKFFMKALTCLPPEIGQCAALEKANLWCNYLSTLPDSMSRLNLLTTLNLNMNNFTEFPLVLLSLEKLTSLNLARNAINTLPQNIDEFKNLIELDLSENKLSSLPDSLCNLSKLQYLSLQENEISSLPAQFGSLVSLIRVNLSKNKLRLVPESLQDLAALQSLNLSFNRLVLLPEGMTKLLKLKTLKLNNNYLMEFNKNILKLPALKTLYLYYVCAQNQLSIAKENVRKFNDVFTEKLSQPIEPFNENDHETYCELID